MGDDGSSINNAGSSETRVALIVGVTGLVGKELLSELLSAKPDWKVYGIARKPDDGDGSKRYEFIPCDLLDTDDVARKLSPLRDVTHVFWVTWAAQSFLDPQACRDQNRAMMSNVLDVLLPRSPALKHVSLQTGMKHYIRTDGTGARDAVYNEESPRIAGENNFYYALEDLLRDRLAGPGWSVHRPGLVLGCSTRTWFNVMGGLGVYAALCRRLRLPFRFRGSRTCWAEPYLDASDARLVARQHVWAATDARVAPARGQAFNAVNGPTFAWREIWPALAARLQVEAPPEEEALSPESTFSGDMADKGRVWEEIVEEEGLRATRMEDVANWWFMDAVLRCPVKLLGSREKADRFGFTETLEPAESILYWVDRMREEKLIP
ncbi:hypothetical protein H6P81_006893 [Aristolochia fimbriata]|uniref:PRISE-like Rossmann-fold domain-containing protein n=1 Tax=Aristolochia fimbriata TaxID=158543 RepID=A0AAV7EZG0_ARIFI|nr:hypothetical protein H6P81_006893 [Aristolochia fimbriata]